MTLSSDSKVLLEPMSPFLAVFNGHVNNADKRARAHLARTVRGRVWLKQVEDIEAERKGIMGIFDDWTKPTGVRRYIKLVTKFVNENRPSTTSDLGGEEAR